MDKNEKKGGKKRTKNQTNKMKGEREIRIPGEGGAGGRVD